MQESDLVLNKKINITIIKEIFNYIIFRMKKCIFKVQRNSVGFEPFAKMGSVKSTDHSIVLEYFYLIF
jgi:hypothetical protein